MAALKIKPTKVCPVCGTEFEAKTINHTYCCSKCKRRQYYKDHKEYIRESFRKYYQEHRDKRIEYSRKYNQEHIDERKKYFEKFNQEHMEERKEYFRQYRKKNKEKINAYNRKYRHDHPDYLRNYRAARKMKNEATEEVFMSEPFSDENLDFMARLAMSCGMTLD